MTAFSQYLQQQILTATLKAGTYTGASTVYAALGTAVSTDGTGFTEVNAANAANYARQAVAFGTVTANGTKHQVSNSADVTYSQAATLWGAISHVALYDTITGGNQLYWGPLSNVRTVDSGSTFKFGSGDLQVQVD